MSIKFFDMFSGIGGFRSGLEALDGFECVGYCEIDKYAKKAYEELNKHEGNIWTAIISLRREDAERLDYNNGARWRDMLRSQTIAMAKNMKISIKNLRWYAAFHNESHHPHVHLILYSTDPDEGYLTERGIENLRSSFARESIRSIPTRQEYLPASTSSESSKRAYGTDYLYDILKNHQYYEISEKGNPVNWALRADIDTERNEEGVGLPREIVVYDSQIQCIITTGGMRDPDGPLRVVRPAMWISNTVQKHR